MPDDLRNVGIRFVAEGLPDFVSAMNQAGQGVQGFGEKSQKSLLGQIAIGTMLGNVLTGAMNAVVAGFQRGVGAVESFGKESIIAAGRVDELHLVADLMGRKAGKTSEEVDNLVMSVRNMGIETGVANKTLIDFTRYNLDLANASKLARVAQDAAVIANTDSSSALARLLHGVTTQQTEVLRGLGIQVDMNQAMKAYAEENKTTAQALDGNQRTQAALNAVLKEGEKISGSYEQAMGSAVKQIGSMTGRIIPDLQNAIGGPLQGAFYQITKGANDFLLTLTAMFTPAGQMTNEMKKMADQAGITGGEFVPLLTKINYAGEGIGQAARAIIPQFVNALVDMGDKGGEEAETIAKNAFEWGTNIMYQLAIGIVQGVTFVVSAISSIAGVIGDWLAPGSPPKALPNLPVWGLNAINQFLKGFMKADFSSLQDLSGPLQSALMSMVSAGGLQKQDAMGMFLSLQGSIMKSLKSGKELSGGMYKKIADSTSEYGNAIAELVKREVSLNIVLRQVEAAEKAVKEAREAETEGAKKANDMIKEYNKALLAGAPSSELEEKRKAIQAEVENVKAAREKRKENEKILEEASKQAKPLQEQLTMQKLLTNQLISYKQGLQQIEEMQKAAAKAATPKGGGGGGMKVDPEKIKSEIQKALDGLDLSSTLDKVKKQFQPVLDGAMANLDQALQKAGENFGKVMRGILGGDTTLKGGPIVSGLEVAGGKVIETKSAIEKMSEALQGVLDKLNEISRSPFVKWLGDNLNMVPRIATALIGWRTIGAMILPLLVSIGGAWGILIGVVLLFATAIVVFWPQITKLFNALWETILANIPLVVGLISAVLLPAIIGITGPVGIIVAAVVALAAAVINYWPVISQFFVNLWASLQEIAKQIGAWLTGAIGSIIIFFINLSTTVWTFISTFFTNLVDGITADINAFLVMAQGWLELLKRAVYEPLAEVYNGLVQRFNQWITLVGLKLKEIKNSFAIGWDNIVATVKTYIAKFLDIGRLIVDGLKKGFEQAWNGFLTLVTGLFEKLPAWVRNLLDMSSPSKVFMEIGMNISRGLTIGMEKQNPEVKASATRMVQATVSPAPSSRQVAERSAQRQAQYNNSVTFNAKVDSGIDLAVLRQIIVQTVQAELNA